MLRSSIRVRRSNLPCFGVLLGYRNAQSEQKEAAMHDGFADFAFTPAVEQATRPVWDKVKSHVTPLEWRSQAPLIAAINALKRSRKRGHPGAQLHDPGHLPWCRRLCRRQPGAGARGGQIGGVDHRSGRRALHGRDLQGALPGQDRADPRPPRRLFPGRLDHRRGRAPDQAALSGPAGGHLRQHHRRGEGREPTSAAPPPTPCRWWRSPASGAWTG